ncbi:hypothetical protein QBC46DRAFT_410029 [Diplogelasinospora grovesii]|uniref:Uncharacterized protein n=1 Tax=Diplogelasinospora grovesii TaxID=303347 RepID=A0AAN6N3L9_9PEZI|nr:hypothetical protein QBC46DRAFT_410029 [Diplogelasinospora grovesii]
MQLRSRNLSISQPERAQRGSRQNAPALTRRQRQSTRNNASRAGRQGAEPVSPKEDNGPDAGWQDREIVVSPAAEYVACGLPIPRHLLSANTAKAQETEPTSRVQSGRVEKKAASVSPERQRNPRRTRKPSPRSLSLAAQQDSDDTSDAPKKQSRPRQIRRAPVSPFAPSPTYAAAPPGFYTVQSTNPGPGQPAVMVDHNGQVYGGAWGYSAPPPQEWFVGPRPQQQQHTGYTAQRAQLASHHQVAAGLVYHPGGSGRGFSFYYDDIRGVGGQPHAHQTTQELHLYGKTQSRPADRVNSMFIDPRLREWPSGSNSPEEAAQLADTEAVSEERSLGSHISPSQ